MKQLNTVKIQDAIVHLVDSKQSVLTLSTRKLAMTKASELSQYFQGHTKNSLRDSSARTAVFNSNSKLLPLATSALTSPSKFVDLTQKIATHLYESSDRRISTGAVAMCLYSSPEEPTVRRFLSMLKLDPADGFHPVEKTDRKGSIYIEFEKVEDVVPSTGEKLLKCAFVRPRPKAAAMDYDLVVLDRQATGTNEPANFFIQKFLGAEYFGDASDMTKKFYTSAVKAVENLRSDIGNTKAEKLRKSVDAALTGTNINLGQWVANLRISQAKRQKVQDALEQVIPDGSFDVDESVARKMVQKRTFKGSHGFRMTMDSEQYEQIVKSRDTKSGYEEIVLHVPSLQEVT